MEIAESIEDPSATFEKTGGFVPIEGAQLVEPGFTDAEDHGRTLRIDGILTARGIRAFSDIQRAMVNKHVTPRLLVLSPPILRLD
jgi:hypothetical protein